MTRGRLAASLLLFACTCGGERSRPLLAHPEPAPSSPPVVVPPPPPPRDDGRLPGTATPLRYVLSLHIDPTPHSPGFIGHTTILVDVPQPTWHLVLHGRGLQIHRATATPVGATPIPATASSRVAHGGVQPEELVLTLATELPAGQAVLEIDYEASFSKDLAGLYLVEEAGATYAFSQFEATDARRAFPCFDEPGFKTPYDVSISAPRGMMALSNSPEISHEDGPNGMVVHRFETSPPLPSYLVAFAVGDFDVREGQTSPFPIRVVTTRGRAALGRSALEAATALVAKLGEYFDMRYPYAKLDLVAVPDFAAGAMENPGLITFRDVLVLLDPPKATTFMRRRQALVIAHELAHQWFGDLVTMQWWDDIWLNEGFATWAEAKAVDAWKPAFGATADEIAGVEEVMDLDSLASARAVRQPVHSSSDAEESFDELTYDKGAAILRMIESWLGDDTFRRGIRRYIAENAWRNARADDLFKALDFVSAQKVGELAGGFLDQPGVPNVKLAWKCGGKGGGVELELQQSTWRPLGGAELPPRRWIVPFCAASDVEKTKTCFTLGEQPILRGLGARCPGWLYPNADQGGYYRYDIDAAQLRILAGSAARMSGLDRMGLVAGVWAELRQGRVDARLLFDVLPRFDGDPDRHVVEQVISVLDGVGSLVDDPSREGFRRYVSERLGGKAKALGWEPGGKRPQEDEEALERRAVWSAMGELAEDKSTLSQAEKYASKWLEDPGSVSPDVVSIALPLASKRAGLPRLKELREAARRTTNPEERMTVIRAMGSFDDPSVLRQALDVALTDELRLSELVYLFRAAVHNRAGRPVVFAWEKDNWGKLLERIPGTFGRATLVDVAGTMCTKADVEQAEAFFVPATKRLEGVQRPLVEKLEQAHLCVALRDHAGAEISKRLAK